MENYDVRNYVKHKAFAQSIVSELSIIVQKINEKSYKIAEQYNELNLQLANSKSVYHAEQISKNIDDVQKKLIYILSVLDKLNKIIDRNQKRIKLLDQKINSEKVTIFAFSKKDMQALLSKEKIKISDDALNLNKNNDLTLTFYCHTILCVENNQLSLENEQNYKLLNSLEDKEFKIITDKFPKSLMTISDEELLDVKFKQRILKQIISICDSKLKNASAQEMNEFFGCPLFLNYKIPTNMNEFVDEIKNLFNVRTKRYVIKTFPYLEKYANSKLICDENSQTLPKELLISSNSVLETSEQDNYSENIIEDNSKDEIDDTKENVDDSDIEDNGNVDDFNQFLMDLLDGNVDDDSTAK